MGQQTHHHPGNNNSPLKRSASNFPPINMQGFVTKFTLQAQDSSAASLVGNTVLQMAALGKSRDGNHQDAPI